jgi:hypothetical protein
MTHDPFMTSFLSLSYDMTKTVLYYDDMPRYDLDRCPCHAYATLMPRHALFLLTLRFGLDFYTSRLVCCTSLRVYCTFIALHLHLYLRWFSVPGFRFIIFFSLFLS